MGALEYLTRFQSLISQGRETIPQSTAAEARECVSWAAAALDLEFIDDKEVIPSFVLVPREAAPPRLTLFATWHAETIPVLPAAVEGAERLALTATLAAVAAIRGETPVPASIVVAPAGTQGSRVVSELLVRHRERLRAPTAFWIRIMPEAPRRRRIYLGARGRVVLGIWGDGANPHRIRDELVRELRAEAYGPRPLDFELLRKLGRSQEALAFLDETIDDPQAVPGEGEERLRSALFDPRGQVVTPPARHPDRPRAWIVAEAAESMEPSEVLARVRALAGGAKVEMAEGFFWDRLNIHHPAIHAEISLSKEVSAGPEIWPMAPWVTPSGVFSRSLGTPLAEWSIPLPPTAAARAPKQEAFEAIVAEAHELLRRGAGIPGTPKGTA